MKRRLSFSLFASLLAFAVSCSKQPAVATTTAPVAQHEHKAPHAGTPVVLGNEAYHLELVREAATGKLTAYVLDGEMEEFIRVKAATFEIVAIVAGAKQTLTLTAVANAATGEAVGSTSQFEATADWLKSTANFDGTLTALEIKGTNFTTVAFNFPKGND